MNTIDIVLACSIATIIFFVLFKLVRSSQKADNDPEEITNSAPSRVWLSPVAVIAIVLVASFLLLRLLNDGDRARADESLARYASLERASQKSASDLAGAQAAIVSLKTSLADLGTVKASAAEQAAEIENLRQQVGTLKDQLASKNTEVDILRHKAQESEDSAAAAAANLAALQKQLRDAKIESSSSGLKFSSSVLFASKQSSIDCDKKDVMAPVIAFTMYTLARSPKTTITIVGHTDNQWSGVPPVEVAARNQTLSEERATNVMDYLRKAGISDTALSAVGRGMWQPVGFDSKQSPDIVERSNRTEEARSKNRRVEFIVNRPDHPGLVCTSE